MNNEQIEKRNVKSLLVTPEQHKFLMLIKLEKNISSMEEVIKMLIETYEKNKPKERKRK